jgi:hypothetical protein
MMGNRPRETLRRALRIDPQAFDGAGRFLVWAGVCLALLAFLLMVWPISALEPLLGVGVLLILGFGIALAGQLFVLMIRSKSSRFWWGVLLVVAMSFLLLRTGGVAPRGMTVLLLCVLLGPGLTGGCLALLRRDGFRWLRFSGLMLGIALTMALVIFAVLPGSAMEKPERPSVAATSLALPNPGIAGSHAVRTLTYGSGNDRQRPEFRAEVTLRSRTVDGSRLLDGWEGAAGWARTRYWGFDDKALPLNGRVWMPEGEGPFPVVLIVHGNHLMEDFSDAGYAWLGEHFASHGVFTVSVDENFLNSGYSDLLAGLDGGLDKENDARGWLLLEHLRQLREWTNGADNPFSGKLDLERVVLIGHSRGGEAVAEAALFNRLRVFPDDARLQFDYGFGLQGLIAIAPIDGQYQPRSRDTLIDDVSYLVIHGSLDGDVQSYSGAAQFSRITYPECAHCFKAGIYVLGANHGQFNTGWGRADYSYPGRLFLNLQPIMDGELQRAVAKPVFTAFLLTTLFGRDEYRAVFESRPRRAPWVETPVELISEYRSGDEVMIAGFEEDADLETGTLPVARLSAAGLTIWRESEVQLKWDPLDSAAVVLGWNRADDAPAPAFTLNFEAPPTAFSAFSFSLAMSEESPLDDEEAEWEVPEWIDFSIVVTDRNGERVTIPLGDLGVLPPPVHAHTRKHPWLDATATTEPVFTRYRIEAQRLSSLDLAEVGSIEFVFDRSAAGMVLLDDLALTPAPVPVEPLDVESGE